MQGRKNYIQHNWTYMNILSMDMKQRVKLHLTASELHFTDEDWELLKNSTVVDLIELRNLIIYGGFRTLDIREETGLSPAMWTGLFSKKR